jgi:VanZ family protein
MHAGRFALAVAVAAGLVLSAPFVGQVRSLIRQAFPGHFVLVVGGVIALLLCAGLAAGLRRIRDRRGVRYGAVAAALIVATMYSIDNAGENPDSNVVELFHFVQYGLIAFLFYRAWRPLGDLGIVILPALAGVMVGTVEEWWQWFIPVRVGEVKDVLLNLVAIGTGLIFSLAVDPPPGAFAHLGARSHRQVRALASAAVLVFGVFFHIVHLGHRVHDPEIGVFTSRWTGAALVSAMDAKATEWRGRPPATKVVRLSREDQYLTEGIQHVRERNRLWDAGAVRGAWLENRILEKYYEPVLDTPTHEGAGHRWPLAQRADAEQRGAAAPAEPYISNAYPYRLYTWPPWIYWIVVIAAAAVSWLRST